MERYKSTLLSTKEVKLRELNFKIFHNILPTNIMLEKMKIKSNNKCDYCENVDFIEHALISCERLNSFWHNICEWIKKELKIDISQEKVMYKLFGILKADFKASSKWQIKQANHALLIAKFSIWKSKYMEEKSLEKIFEREVEKRLTYFKNNIA